MKVISKKYKIIILGDNMSGKTYLINTLKHKNSNDFIFNYYPIDSINFYKYYDEKEKKNKINNKLELHQNILYMYDTFGKKTNTNLIKNYINKSQICLIVINPDNYCNVNSNIEFITQNIIESIRFWVNLYIKNYNNNMRYLILICINKNSSNTSSNNYNKTWLKNIKFSINNNIHNINYINNIYFIDSYDFKYESKKLINNIISEINNNEILNIMTKSNKKINTNIKNDKLYFKKEINYNQNYDKDIDDKTCLLKTIQNNTQNNINNNQYNKYNCFIM